MIPLENAALLYGFYLNELLLKLLAREDPHPGLFDQVRQGVDPFGDVGFGADGAANF